MRALLRRPLNLSDTPEFSLIRKHGPWLMAWLARHPRWALTISPEQARLRKTPGDVHDGTRPAREPRSGAVFTRRRYAVFCLLLAVLERADRQITLGRLVEQLLGEFAELPELGSFSLANRDHRRDLVHAVRLLSELGALRRVAGDEAAFVESQEGDALYTVAHRTLAVLLDTRHPPSLVSAETLDERIDAIAEEPAADTEAGRYLALRTRLFRRLLDDPVIYYADLPEEERAYFATQRPSLVREVCLATGLVEEARREGIAMVDPEAALSDLAMPEEGTEGHLTLLLAEWLQKAGSVSPTAVEAQVAALIRAHGERWKKEVREPGAERALTVMALDRLEALGLVRQETGSYVARPALARYRVLAPLVPPSPVIQLFPQARTP